MYLEFHDATSYDIILEISSLIDGWIGNRSFFNEQMRKIGILYRRAIFNLVKQRFETFRPSNVI